MRRSGFGFGGRLEVFADDVVGGVAGNDVLDFGHLVAGHNDKLVVGLVERIIFAGRDDDPRIARPIRAFAVEVQGSVVILDE